MSSDLMSMNMGKETMFVSKQWLRFHEAAQQNKKIMKINFINSSQSMINHVSVINITFPMHNFLDLV